MSGYSYNQGSGGNQAYLTKSFAAYGQAGTGKFPGGAALGTKKPLVSSGMQQLTPRIQSHGSFEAMEQTFQTWVSGTPKGKSDLWKAWHAIDYNGNGRVSLAEIDKWAVDNYPLLNNKPALMRAYKATSANEKDGYVHKVEFPVLLRNVIYFNKLWDFFEGMDENQDRRLNFSEFRTCLAKIGLGSVDPKQVFNALDTNRGGIVLFDELCKWVASVHCPVDSAVYEDVPLPKPAHHHRHGNGQHGGRHGGHQNGQPTGQNGGLVGGPRQRGGLNGSQFNDVESKFKSMLKNKRQLQGLWKRIDYNGNGCVSLAEIDKLIGESYPVLNNKPALMRAYKATSRGGDDFVHKKEFTTLLRNLLYFNKCWAVYEIIDTDADRRMDFPEFQRGCGHLGLAVGPGDAKEEFDFMDTNGGGIILFDEFCRWVATKKMPLD